MNRLREYARVLLGKARDDQYVLARLVDDADAPPWTLGFHAQQAVEKAIKAVLNAGDVEYLKTHGIQRLLGLASSAGLPLPLQAAQLPLLPPFGAALRYDEVPEMEGGKPLDRAWALAVVRSTIAWAESFVTEKTG